jgi:hypothetical protein
VRGDQIVAVAVAVNDHVNVNVNDRGWACPGLVDTRFQSARSNSIGLW